MRPGDTATLTHARHLDRLVRVVEDHGDGTVTVRYTTDGVRQPGRRWWLREPQERTIRVRKDRLREHA